MCACQSLLYNSRAPGNLQVCVKFFFFQNITPTSGKPFSFKEQLPLCFSVDQTFFRCTYPSQWASHCTAVGDSFRFRRELLHLPQLNAIATLKPTFTFLVGILPYSILLLGKIPTKKVKVGFRVAMASQPFNLIFNQIQFTSILF